VSEDVIVPAEKLPEPSLDTNVDAVFALVALDVIVIVPLVVIGEPLDEIPTPEVSTATDVTVPVPEDVVQVRFPDPSVERN
jgi:hypothetical protein